MLVEVIKTFKKRSDGQILHPGDVIDASPEKILPLISKGAIRPIARFKVGQHVRFNIFRALNILEGVIVEKKWHGPVIGWWYLIENPGGKFWTSESHIQHVQKVMRGTWREADRDPCHERRSVKTALLGGFD